MRGKKVWFAVKWIVLWCMTAAFIVIYMSDSLGIHFSLLLTDFRNRFVDDVQLLKSFENKVIAVSILFLVCLIIGLCTEDFEWKLKLFRRHFCISKKSKAVSIVFHGFLLVMAAVFCVKLENYVRPDIRSAFAENWQGDMLIAHAGGGIDEDNYTNSREAFEYSYAAGARTIELDFLMTTDERLVCWHDWEREINPEIGTDVVLSSEEFLGTKIMGKYTPLSLEDVFELMKKYDDVYVVTDTKDDTWAEIIKEFRIIVDTAEKTDSMEVLDRLVVQLYNHDMYDAVESVYHFPNYILTLYLVGGSDGESFIEHCRFCKNRGIKGITMWESWANPENLAIAERYGLDVYVHTVNNVDKIEEDRAFGVKGFYTDFVLPEMLE